ncbi:MAG: hypothetical protein MMC33_000151 [Icmadophila ericetorum]|nr:hypothetical protein [Icmadophila ericetorum]
MSTDSKPQRPVGKKPLSVPRPSASVLLISPLNHILLLHRVKTSTSFASAHVFPGGNLSVEQDGEIPAPEDPLRHQDGRIYRLGAVRETFEESGILLAKRKDNPEKLLELSDAGREEGRHAIHENRVKFTQWLDEKGGVPDIDALIPFTRWVTPSNVPKRFTTQMYIYFLPLRNGSPSAPGGLGGNSEAVIPTPTSDGGIEHTTARFLPASKWLSLSRAGDIVLFPPQFFLLYLLAQFLCPEKGFETTDREELNKRRQQVVEFVHSGNPPWTEKCISPNALLMKSKDGQVVLGLSKPGPELEGSGRRGDDELVVLAKMSKNGPRKVDVARRKDVLQEEREVKEKL